MKLIATFNTEAAALRYITGLKHDNVLIDRNIFSGCYEVYDMS